MNYKEGPESSFRTMGKTYLVDDALELSQEVETELFPISELEWVLAFAIHNPMRLIIANYNHPVLIAKEMVDNEMKLVVVDGLHRLVKAKMDGLVEIPGKLIELEKLNLI